MQCIAMLEEITIHTAGVRRFNKATISDAHVLLKSDTSWCYSNHSQIDDQIGYIAYLSILCAGTSFNAFRNARH